MQFQYRKYICVLVLHVSMLSVQWDYPQESYFLYRGPSVLRMILYDMIISSPGDRGSLVIYGLV